MDRYDPFYIPVKEAERSKPQGGVLKGDVNERLEKLQGRLVARI